jgi:hypothetical protein
MSAKLSVTGKSGGVSARGFCTPKEDKQPQRFCVPAKRVIPIVFIPGIMGSNLRMTEGKQVQLGRKNNIAWNPDNIASMWDLRSYQPSARQLQLDQATTEVEIYDPAHNPTGNSEETADERHGSVTLSKELKGAKGKDVLFDPTLPVGRDDDMDKKARRRGWGEVYFGSYKDLLQRCELSLNDLSSMTFWEKILDVQPSSWGGLNEFSLPPLSLKERNDALKGCVFPVHAIGYNWLQTNLQSALVAKRRIEDLIARYQQKGFDCRKVILVTHSMGGLVARAIVHPSVGGISEKILGVVHGVMPDAGAPAAYKRVRCGVEGVGITSEILGQTGAKVAAVMANSPGALELLPSAKYGNGWLKIKQGEQVIKKLPTNGDPYDEIYQLRNAWYGLLVDEWVNPARDTQGGPERTRGYIRNAKYFHELISDTYHDNSYAHYGADTERPSWESVVWEVGSGSLTAAPEKWKVCSDSGKGMLQVITGDGKHGMPSMTPVKLGDATGPGDQTVPVRSADLQLTSGKFKGIFRQQGYEHQASYSDENALRSTIYCIVRIAQQMKWS